MRVLLRRGRSRRATLEEMSASAPFDPVLSEEPPMAVLLVQDGRIVEASARAAALLGPGAAPGATIASLFDEGSRAKLEAALAVDRSRTVELQSLREGPEPAVVRLRIEPLGAARLLVACGAGPDYPERAEHQLLEMNARLTNLTRELSQQRAELTAAKAELERLGALRDAWMASLSHDIRSPMTAIAFVAAAQEKRVGSLAPEDVVRHAQAIRRNVDRVLRLVDDILDSARLDSGEAEMTGRPTSLAVVAADVVDSLEPIAVAAGVRLDVPVAKEGGWVVGDPLRLFQIIANLVSNAIRHTTAGGTVRIVIEEDGDAVRCAVRDEGAGVPPELRPHVFERFRQGGERAGSVGLGLYIVRRLVELHGGRIWLEEAGLRGAGFAFELDRAQSPLERHS
jgi:signal transduction histidine kinase